MPECRDCKNCIHYSLCNYEEICHYDIDNIKNAKDCSFFQDRSRFVELPCKLGDTVYFVFELSDGEVRIDPVKVCNYTIKTDKIKIHTSMGYFTETDLNKDVFLTREEAVQALKERENDAN